MKKALIVVDVQNDFVEGGSLAVTGGEAVSHKIASFIKQQKQDYDVIAFTKDWHKPWPDTNGGHFSETPDFVNNWPIHCVEYTEGAKFHWAIEHAHEALATDHIVFKKGNGRPDYSGFQGYNDKGSDLLMFLIRFGIEAVDVVGIAGDYCVAETALDAIVYGFKTRIIPELVASVGGDTATNETIKMVKRFQ